MQANVKRIVVMDDIIRVSRPPQKTARAARGFLRTLIAIEKQVLVFLLSFGLILLNAHSFIAFEAHVVNVKAEVAQIDPPVISPPGGNYSGSVDIIIDDADLDATHIFYTQTPGTDSSVAPDPACGDSLGGAKPRGPVTLTEDTVVKAVACDGPSGGAHMSSVTTEVYDFPQERGVIRGYKYFDADRSGTLTAGDFPIEGWQIQTATSTFATSTVTDASGYYTFRGLLPDDYTLEEESRAGWEHITSKTIQVTIDGSETEEVNFFNFDTGFACLPKDINFPAGLAVQAAGLTSENNDDIALASNVTINGDARSNDDIERTSGASNVDINGSATSTDQVDDGINVSKLVLEGAATASLPDAMISEWRARAADGGVANGSFIFPNGTVGLTLGPVEILGDLKFGSSNGATISGPIYVHGNLEIGSNTVITQDAAFGDQFVAIVVDGTVDISSNVSFNGSGARGTLLLISTRAAIAGDDAAIETSSNNSDLGDVVLYASDGDIHVRSNRTLLAAFAAHSADIDSSANAAIRFDSNVTVNYRALPDKISCGPRQPYETTSRVVINEFMPNPVGPDQGAAGAPLDGEWVELFNPTSGAVDVAGWYIYDNNNTHDLPITLANINSGSLVIPPGGYLIVYRDGDSDFELNNSSADSVRLFSGAIGSGGVIVDAHAYTVNASENKSFARVPDGSANWVDPDATPGAPNIMSFFVPLSDPSFEPADLPLLDITPPEFTPIEPSLPLQSEEASQIAAETEQAKPEEPAIVELPQITDDAGDGDGGDGGELIPTPTPEPAPEFTPEPTQTPEPTPEITPEPMPTPESTPTLPTLSEGEIGAPADNVGAEPTPTPQPTDSPTSPIE